MRMEGRGRTAVSCVGLLQQEITADVFHIDNHDKEVRTPYGHFHM